MAEEALKLSLTPQQSAEIKKQIGFDLSEIYLTKRSLNKLRVFRLRLSEDQQQTIADAWGQKVKELTVTRSVATRIM
jgi:chloramphenicol O-acetyltransferase